MLRNAGRMLAKDALPFCGVLNDGAELDGPGSSSTALMWFHNSEAVRRSCV
ncbi:hypothetical protein D3C87_1720360 [compost metagenome]